MRVARIELDGRPRVAVIEDEHALALPAQVGVLELLTADERERARLLQRAETPVALPGIRLLAPIEPASVRDFSVFEQHIEGAVRWRNPAGTIPPAWYEGPVCYFSNPHAITGPGEGIVMPPGTEALDLELEVAVVIGRAGRDVAPERAGEYIAGYTIFNDWSARDLGAREMRLPFGQCKGKDFANTLGPWIVTPEELERYRDGDRLDLELSASVNGSALGTDTLANMAWSFEELIAFASRGAWIRPGDVIGSGTCGFGCLLELWGAAGREDPPPLAPGDEVVLRVQGIGELRNHVLASRPGVTIGPARPGRRRHRAALGA